MPTTLWLVLGASLWIVAACAAGLLLGRMVRLRDVPEARGLVGQPLSRLSGWPPAVATSAVVTTPPSARRHRSPAG
jgi:hypothetical protein